MKIFTAILVSLLMSLLVAFGLEAVIEAFTDQDHLLWIYFLMAVLFHYFVGVSKAE